MARIALGLLASLLVLRAVNATTMENIASSLRPVRVLVGDRLARVSVRSEGSLQVIAAHDPSLKMIFPAGREIAVSASEAGLQVDDRVLDWNDVFIEAKKAPVALIAARDSNEPTESNFAGRLRIIADETLQIINEVEIEDYVASVVASEIWPSFNEEAFRAQAIVTRTYVLYHMLRRTDSAYDVAATQGSQVYRGIRGDAVGRLAAEATEYTRGLVCTWRDQDSDRIFCTYYSAACGGMSQSAAPLGAESDIPPLSGGVRCDYCKIAPGQTYRWGPARLSLREVYQKLCERFPDLTSLRSIRNIEPGELTRFGRPLTWRVTGSAGEPRDVLAERFRLAVAPNVIKSTDCNIRIEGGDVVFDDGKGYGHGLGLCQWGMQGQALEGRKAGEILRYYFPGSRLLRAY